MSDTAAPATDQLPVEFVGTLTADTTAIPAAVVAGPSGVRVTATVASGTFVGPKINATAADGVAGGDWVLVRSDGSILLDVRINLRTDDGADLYMVYNGIGVPGADGKLQIRTAPRFETGDERYSWLNTRQCVALGHQTDTGVVYQVYALQ